MQLSAIKLLFEKKPQPGNKNLNWLLEEVILEESFKMILESTSNDLENWKKIDNW